MAEAKNKTAPKSTTTTKRSTTTKRTGTTAKKAVSKKVEPVEEVVQVVEEPVVKPAVAEVKPEPVIERHAYQATDMIPCKSVRYGLLQHLSKKSGDLYEWADYGDVVDVAYGDLLALKSRKSKFLYAPWFLIMDEQLVEDWKLNDIYTYFEDFEDVEEFLQSGAITLRRNLPNAPQGYKDLIIHKAGEMIRNGNLDSIATIRAIDDVLHKNLADMLGGH